MQLLKCTTFSHVVFPPCPAALLQPAFGAYKFPYVFPGLCPETGLNRLQGEQAGGHLSLEQWEWGTEQ